MYGDDFPLPPGNHIILQMMPMRIRTNKDIYSFLKDPVKRAGGFLQTSHWVSESDFSSKYSKNIYAQDLRARELKFEKMFNSLHLSHVTCHVSPFSCHLSHVIFFLYIYRLFFSDKVMKLVVEGLLLTGPTRLVLIGILYFFSHLFKVVKKTIFNDLGLWAGSVIDLICPCVCPFPMRFFRPLICPDIT